MPAGQLLSSYARVVSLLAAANLCITHHARGHGRINLRWGAAVGRHAELTGPAGGEVEWHWSNLEGSEAGTPQCGDSPPPSQPDAGAAPLVRFPYFPPLLDLIQQPLHRPRQIFVNRGRHGLDKPQ